MSAGQMDPGGAAHAGHDKLWHVPCCTPARETLRPLGLAVILVVVIGSANSRPGAGTARQRARGERSRCDIGKTTT